MNIGAAIFLKKRTISKKSHEILSFSEAGQAAENANETAGPWRLSVKIICISESLIADWAIS